MNKILKYIKELFPILQPEWIYCTQYDIPDEIMSSFFEELEYEKRIGKRRIDIKVKGYRYILTSKYEKYMHRRHVSLL